MKLTYFGHSALGIEVDGFHLLVDPFISGNPLAKSIRVDSLEADFILLTHAHYDHVMDMEDIAKRTGALIIANHEVAKYYQEKGFKCHELNFGGSWNFDFGRVKMVYATHSSTFLDGTNGGNPAGYVLEAGGKTIYLAGDTALTMDMKLIPLFFKLDLAVLPIGGNFTMDVEEALIASDFVECDRVVGIHYDTSDLVKIDHKESKKRFADKDKELILMEIGSDLKV